MSKAPHPKTRRPGSATKHWGVGTEKGKAGPATPHNGSADTRPGANGKTPPVDAMAKSYPGSKPESRGRDTGPAKKGSGKYAKN